MRNETRPANKPLLKELRLRAENFPGGRGGPQKRCPLYREGAIRTGWMGGGAVEKVAFDWELQIDASLVPTGYQSSG